MLSGMRQRGRGRWASFTPPMQTGFAGVPDVPATRKREVAVELRSGLISTAL